MKRWILLGVFWVGFLGGGLAGSDILFVAGGDGIYAFEFDAETGSLSPAILASPVERPAFLAVHPAGWFLFALSNDGDARSRSSSHLVSFFIEPGTGRLHETGRVETGGTTAAYVEVDARRGAVFVANYQGGTVAGFPLGVDGTVGERLVWIEHEGSSVVLPRQAQPHPHAVRVSPDGRHLYVPDLGTDEIFVYEFGEKGVLRPARFPRAKAGEGDGPRHLDFHPHLQVVYVIQEISSRVTMFRRNAGDGSLTAYQSVRTVPEGYRGRNAASEIRVHPSGAFVYGANRGHDSIAVFRVEEGFLSPVGFQRTGGKTPRHFAIHPSGNWLIAGNEESGNLVVFAVDGETGRLEPVGPSVPVFAPVCLVFAPAP